jgi:hypothetical protein
LTGYLNDILDVSQPLAGRHCVECFGHPHCEVEVFVLLSFGRPPIGCVNRVLAPIFFPRIGLAAIVRTEAFV